MARLTRTQKYAELRETLANDPESSLSTKETSDYEDRLNNITNQLENEVRQVQEVAQGIAQGAKEPEEYKWVDFEELTSPIEKLVEDFKGNETNVSAQSQTPEAQVVQPVYQQPVHEEKNINDVMQEINPFEDDFKPAEKEVKEYVPDTTQYHSVEVSPIGDTNQETYESGPAMAEFENEQPEYMGLYMNPDVEKAYKEEEIRRQEQLRNDAVEQQIRTEIVQQHDFEKQVVEDPRVRENEESKLYEPIVEIKKPEEARSAILEEPADNHAIISDDHTNTFISDVMSEVDAHNQQAGAQTINQLTNDMVKEVRHSNRQVEQPVNNRAQQQVKENNQNFSDTVSTEINRIMDEYETVQPVQQPRVDKQPVQTPAPAVQPAPVAPAPAVQPTQVTPAPAVKPVQQQPQQVVKPVVEEHPVLAKTLEEEKTEDVVEIKNIDDTDLSTPPVKDATTGTIPFVVAANDEEFIDDDAEEEGSNTILNVILIVLIIILLAVLGLIIFYILKTKGII